MPVSAGIVTEKSGQSNCPRYLGVVGGHFYRTPVTQQPRCPGIISKSWATTRLRIPNGASEAFARVPTLQPSTFNRQLEIDVRPGKRGAYRSGAAWLNPSGWDYFLFRAADQLRTTVMGVGSTFPVCVFTKKRRPSWLG